MTALLFLFVVKMMYSIIGYEIEFLSNELSDNYAIFQKLFLLQAGDAMYDFYSEVFEKVLIGSFRLCIIFYCSQI